MSEKIVIPHGNQMKTIREIQDEICRKVHFFYPCSHFFIRFEENVVFDSILSIIIEEITLIDSDVFLTASMNSGNRKFHGKIFLGSHLNDTDNKKILFENFSFSEKKLPFILPVFKIANAVISDGKNSLQWKIISEKWVKAKKN